MNQQQRREALISRIMQRDGIDRKAAMKKIRGIKQAFNTVNQFVGLIGLVLHGEPLLRRAMDDVGKGMKILSEGRAKQD